MGSERGPRIGAEAFAEASNSQTTQDTKKEGEVITENLDRKETFLFSSTTAERRAELTRSVEGIIADPDKYIDSGGAADVYRFSSDQICIKVFKGHKSRQEKKTGIDYVGTEARITLRLTGVEVDGVRSPMCYGYWKSDTDGRSAIIMEELDAINLQHVFNGNAQLPSGFDLDTFVDSLYSYIDYLHTEHNIINGDLFARNVMVDKQTGLPRVIDFGESKSVNHTLEEDRRRLENADTDNIDAIYDKLEALTKSIN